MVLAAKLHHAAKWSPTVDTDHSNRRSRRNQPKNNGRLESSNGKQDHRRLISPRKPPVLAEDWPKLPSEAERRRIMASGSCTERLRLSRIIEANLDAPKPDPEEERERRRSRPTPELLTRTTDADYQLAVRMTDKQGGTWLTELIYYAVQELPFHARDAALIVLCYLWYWFRPQDAGRGEIRPPIHDPVEGVVETWHDLARKAFRDGSDRRANYLRQRVMPHLLAAGFVVVREEVWGHRLATRYWLILRAIVAAARKHGWTKTSGDDYDYDSMA